MSHRPGHSTGPARSIQARDERDVRQVLCDTAADGSRDFRAAVEVTTRDGADAVVGAPRVVQVRSVDLPANVAAAVATLEAYALSLVPA